MVSDLSSSQPTEATSTTPPRRAARENGTDRIARLWRAWLASLAHDSDAATAAASLYAALGDEGRDSWLDALQDEAPKLSIDPAAVYGPLLAVEADPVRRSRMVEQCGSPLDPKPRRAWALAGRAAEGACVAAIAQPIYPGFVRLYVARFHRSRGVDWIRDVPIAAQDDVPVPGSTLEGCVLRAAQIDDVLDELAHSVVAHVRAGREVSDTLRAAAGLLSARRHAPHDSGQ